MRTIKIDLYRYSELEEGAQRMARIIHRRKFGVLYDNDLHSHLANSNSPYEFTVDGEWWEMKEEDKSCHTCEVFNHYPRVVAPCLGEDECDYPDFTLWQPITEDTP